MASSSSNIPASDAKMLSSRIISGTRKSLFSSFIDKPFFSRPRNVSHGIIPRKFCSCYPYSFHRNVSKASAISTSQTSLPFASDSPPEYSPFSGVEDVLASYVFGKKKATEIAHKLWEHVVRKGDTVVDATCGNGYDTLTLLKMVADESCQGRVYGLDVQKAALESTSSLLEQSVGSNKKELVKLAQRCHSKMAEVLPEDTLARLVAFNLGYLPGGDKTIITEPQTTFEALKAAEDILMPGGLISLVVYVGHPGGWQELKAVEEFSSELPVDNWIGCKLQMLNRPQSPVLIFLFKKR